MYPTYRQSKRVLECGRSYVTEEVIPGLQYLYFNLKEIHPDVRFSEFNHTPHFSRYVTAIVDTFPVIVEKPVDSVYKFSMACDLLGRIIYFTGPHLKKKVCCMMDIFGEIMVWSS